MEDGTISTCRAVAGVLWTAVISLMVAAWVVLLWGPHEIAAILAATGCCMSAVAAVAQIKCYSTSVCRLIRVTNGLQSPDAEVRDFNGPRR